MRVRASIRFFPPGINSTAALAPTSTRTLWIGTLWIGTLWIGTLWIRMPSIGLQSSRSRSLAACLLALFVLAPSERAAAADTPDTTKVESVPSRLRLTSSRLEAAPVSSGRFTLRARLQREETAGALHEGTGLALLGRFAKAGASCNVDTLFRNGFEN